MRIGFIGTGLMGYPMAARLLAAGHEVFVWNRTRAKAEPLAAKGARLAESAAMAYEFVDATVLMLSDGPAVAVALDQAASLEGKTVVQMSTIAPDESRAFAHTVAGAGGTYFEAPVLGSTPQAEAGQLLVLAAGDRAVFDRLREMLSVFGAPHHIGAVGQGAALKLALNQLIGGLFASFAFSLGLVRRSEIPVDTFMDVLRASPLYAKAFDGKLPRLLADDLAAANFPLKLLRKDMALIAAEGRALGLETSAVEAVLALLDRGMEQGYSDYDYAVVSKVIAP